MTGEKPEPPKHLDMPWGEALSRLIETKPHEVEPPKGKKRPEPRPTPSDKPKGG